MTPDAVVNDPITFLSVFNTAAAHLDMATIVLILLLVGSVWILFKAQQRRNFDFARMLRDDNGKESALNMAILGSFAVSSWTIMHDALSGTLTDQEFWAYLLIWSGARVAVVMAQKWNGTLPWSK